MPSLLSVKLLDYSFDTIWYENPVTKKIFKNKLTMCLNNNHHKMHVIVLFYMYKIGNMCCVTNKNVTDLKLVVLLAMQIKLRLV